MIFERTHRPQVNDKFARRYGGRLLGGMNAEPARNLLTVSQALGLPPSPESRPPAVDTQVDPARLNLGDHFSFVYNKGARAGERRTVTLHEKEKVKGRTSVCLICWEDDPKRAGVVKSVKIWPSLTADVSYHKETLVGPNQQFGPCSAASTLQSPLGLKPSQSVQDTTIGATKLALNMPPEAHGYNNMLARYKTSGGLHWVATGNSSGSAVPVEAAKGSFTLPASPAFQEPSVFFYTGEKMIPIMNAQVDEFKESLYGFQYTLDYASVFMKLCRKLGAGKTVKFILDRKNFFDSSCARQAPRIKELIDAGAKIKILKPEGAGFACMHAKTLIFDEKVVLTGSVNLTHNGLERNKEHLIRVLEPSVVSAMLQDFELTWKQADTITLEDLERMTEKHDNREAKKKSSRSSQSGDASDNDSEWHSSSSKSGSSLSKNASRSVSRSLSAELSPCHEEEAVEKKEFREDS
jgi:hypothetical protein